MAKKKGLSTGYKVADSVISRRNQNGTIILMKTNKAISFYKIEGMATEAWRCFESPQTNESVTEHLTKLYPKKSKILSREVSNFTKKLLSWELLTVSKGPFGKKFPAALADAVKFEDFGSIQEFNLEKIESEVLNDSLYLDVFAGSDLSLKADISPIENALAKVLQLDGITHTWKNAAGIKNPKSVRAGLIAQQVAVQMPELVRKDESTGVLAVDYQKLNSYLVESIKDLNRIILDQEKRIKKLESSFRQQPKH
jgi:Chaperone of endosialidase